MTAITQPILNLAIRLFGEPKLPCEACGKPVTEASNATATQTGYRHTRCPLGVN